MFCMVMEEKICRGSHGPPDEMLSVYRNSAIAQACNSAQAATLNNATSERRVRAGRGAGVVLLKC